MSLTKLLVSLLLWGIVILTIEGNDDLYIIDTKAQISKATPEVKKDLEARKDHLQLHVELICNRGDADLEDAARLLPWIRKLTIRDTVSQVNSLESLAKFAQLRNLDLSQLDNAKRFDISPVCGLKSLVDLNCCFLKSADELKELTELRRLDFGDSGIADITFIRHLTKLESLTLGNRGLKDLSALRELKSLKYLSLRLYHGPLDQLNNVVHLKGLENVDLGFTDVRDLSFLRECKKLRTLDVGNAWELRDISALKDCRELRDISIFKTKVSDLSPLKNMAQLEKLDLGMSHVSSLASLGQLPKLTSLRAPDTKLNDLAAVVNFPKLVDLNIDGTPIRSLKPLFLLKQLRCVWGIKSLRVPEAEKVALKKVLKAR